jgi:hypothetical protein
MPFAPDDEYGGRVVVESLDARRWRLARPLRYTGARDTYTVPMAYVTDFATVPRVAVWLIPVFGKYTRASILHDWLLTDGIPSGLVSSVDADGIFRRAMRELDVPPVRRWLMWTGVRWGALGKRRRRAGWARTAPAVVGITIVALPLALPMAAVAAGLALYGVAEAIATGGRRRGTLNT